MFFSRKSNILFVTIACLIGFPTFCKACMLQSIVQTVIDTGSLTPEVAARIQHIERGYGINVSFESGNTLLHWAAQMPARASAAQGDLIQFLFVHGADASRQNKAGETPLHLATQNNRRALQCIIERLSRISGEMNFIRDIINIQDAHGRTALHNAVISGYEDTVQLLVQEEAALIEDETGKSPLFYAVLGRNRVIIRMLLTPRVISSMSLIILQTIHQLIEAERSDLIEPFCEIIGPNKSQASSELLHQLARKHIFPNLIVPLLHTGANPWYTPRDDYPTLCHVLRARDMEHAEAMITAAHAEGTPTQKARLFVQLFIRDRQPNDVIMFLIRHGLQNHLSLEEQRMVFTFICDYKRWNLLILLLDLAIEITDQTTDFDILLQIFNACKGTEDGKEQLRKLFACHIDRYTQPGTQQSLIHYFVEHDAQDDLKLALSLGANPNHINQERKTPLFEAVLTRKDECAVCLLMCPRTDVLRTDHDGRTVLFYMQEENLPFIFMVSRWAKDHIPKPGGGFDLAMIKKLYHEIQIPKFKKPDSLLEAQACLIRLAHRILSWFSRFNFNPDNEKHIILWFDIFTGYMVETTRTFERESCCTRFANCLLVTSALTALFILVEIILLSRYQPITFPR